VKALAEDLGIFIPFHVEGAEKDWDLSKPHVDFIVIRESLLVNRF
jgi:hypothetical protein